VLYVWHSDLFVLIVGIYCKSIMLLLLLLIL